MTNEMGFAEHVKYIGEHPMAYNPSGVFYNRRTNRARLAMGVVKDGNDPINWDSAAMERGE